MKDTRRKTRQDRDSDFESGESSAQEASGSEESDHLSSEEEEDNEKDLYSRRRQYRKP